MTVAWMKTTHRSSHGFTLMEIMVATTLIGLVGLAFAFLFVTAQRQLIQNTNITASQDEAAYAMEHITRFLRLATAIDTPVGGVAGNTLVFRYTPANGGVEQTVTYRRAGNNLEFEPNAGAGFTIVARGITQLNFSRVANPLAVDVTINAQATSGGDTRDQGLQTSISPRGLFPTN